ncbi:MAG: hypothetical protein ACRD4Q_09280 [Candidatus Acidiferrales bacterium]
MKHTEKTPASAYPWIALDRSVSLPGDGFEEAAALLTKKFMGYQPVRQN